MTALTEQERKDIWSAAVSVGSRYDGHEADLWNPRGAAPISHTIVFTQVITHENAQWVCGCGHVGDSYGSTVAEKFGQHLRRQHELVAPTAASAAESGAAAT